MLLEAIDKLQVRLKSIQVQELRGAQCMPLCVCLLVLVCVSVCCGGMSVCLCVRGCLCVRTACVSWTNCNVIFADRLE